MGTILAVDDEPRVLTFLTAFLTDEGHRVLTAGDGRDALDLLDQQPVSLVLLDLMMPRVNGLQMLDALKARTETPPVIVLSAASDVAATLLKAADSDKGGSLSLEEIVKALGSDAGSDASKAFAALDTNGDGALASDELTRGLQAMTSRQMSAYAANVPATAAPAASVSIAA